MASARMGKYRLLAPRGAGGMAEVFVARADGPAGFSRTVIVKRLRREHAADATFVRLLAAEARLCARLKHPGIVEVYELGEDRGEFFLAMEYVDGWDLEDLQAACRRAGRTFPPELVALIGARLADALAYAHALAGEDGQPLAIVHRDVSPSNVMVDRSGRVKLVDFGVAKVRDSHVDERTRTGLLKGKLAYLSPEQADGEAVDARSDLFALGIVLHELLTGRRVFRGESDLETLKLVRQARVAPPSSFVAGVPAGLDELVVRLLARSPAERPADGDEVRRALLPLTAGADDGELRGFVESLDLAPPGEGAGEPGERRTVVLGPNNRPPAWRVFAIAGGLAVLAVLPFFWPRHASRRPAPALPATDAGPSEAAPALP